MIQNCFDEVDVSDIERARTAKLSSLWVCGNTERSEVLKHLISCQFVNAEDVADILHRIALLKENRDLILQIARDGVWRHVEAASSYSCSVGHHLGSWYKHDHCSNSLISDFRMLMKGAVTGGKRAAELKCLPM
jgi:hypothetical protein